MNYTVHPESEFNKLDWSSLDPERFNRYWSYAFGGHGLPDWKMHIDIYDKTLNADIWVVPVSFQEIIKSVEKVTTNDIRHQIKSALGL